MNYFDILLAKKLEDDRDPKVEGLSVTENGRYHEDGVVYDPVIVNVPETPLSKLTVTENGTYTAPSGTGYNEVDVNVPLPENAYLLKEIEDVEIASFSDGSDLPMPKLEVAIEPQQEGSGDPSPENIRPISGWDEVNVTRCGKNAFGGLPMAENIVEVGRNATLDTTNKTVAFTSSVPKDDSYERSISEGFKFKENTVYTFVATYSNSGNNSSLRFRSTTGTNQEIQLANTNGQKTKIAVTTWSDYSLKDIILSFYSASSTTLYYEESGIFEGVLTADDFEPYNGQTYTIDLDGTRYGGEVDVVNGTMTVDRAMVDLGTLTWNYSSPMFYASLNNAKMNVVDVKGNELCSHYKTVAFTQTQTFPDKSVCIIFWMARGVNIKDSSYTDATAFKTAMNGVQLVYELATPLTIQLTPTLVKSLRGVNNVYADCGNILDLSYLAKEE